MQIETKRLNLRTTCRDDLDAVAAIWGDFEGGKYMSDPYYTSGEELTVLLEDTPDWPIYYFVAVLKDTDIVMATCSLGKEHPDSALWSIGYTVQKAHWGNGYAVEMVHALIDFARSLGIQTLTSPVAQANVTSNRVMEKCGFVIDHTDSFRKSGTDIVYPSYVYILQLS